MSAAFGVRAALFCCLRAATLFVALGVGACTRIRTRDQLIKSQLLYQLSYAGAPVIVFADSSSACRRGHGRPAALLSKLLSNLKTVVKPTASKGANRWSFRTLYIFFLIRHQRRELIRFNVTARPTARVDLSLQDSRGGSPAP